MPNVSSSGSQLITADGVVGTSGKPTRVYSITTISGGGGAAVVSLRNGTSASDTIYITATGVVSTGATVEFGTYGQVFPAGCFVDVDTNTTSVLVAYSQ